MRKYILEITVFLSGAIVMIFELVGSRLFAPFIGTSTYVWTSLIGVILGCLSLGYWLGGKMADKRSDYRILAYLIFTSGIFIGWIIFSGNDILRLLTSQITDIRFSSVIGALILFGIPCVALGAVSPYSVKLKMNDISTSGAVVGNLYAISTMGSIIGTFFAGFALIPSIGSIKILFLLTFALFALAFLVFPGKNFYHVAVAMIILLYLLFGVYKDYAGKNGINVDTKYSAVKIFDTTNLETGQKVRIMNINNESNSAMYLEGDDLVFEYTKYYDLAKHFNPDFKKGLMIGGGAYSYPKYYLKKYLEASIDVVEIDEKLTELSKQYFNLEDDPRLNIFHEDARIFLNQTQNKYDVFFGDAFKSLYSVPYQLTTVETVEKIYESLNDKGVALINIISPIKGESGKFLQAEYLTYKEVFPYVYIFLANESDDPYEPQNLMLVAQKTEDRSTLFSEDEEMSKYLSRVWSEQIESDVPILTDNFAPVEHYLSSALIQ